MRISDWSSDVCSSDLDIPEIGDYFKVDLGRESFIVVRNGPGDHDIAAYYNVCPHRGNRIAHGDFGSVGSDGCFRCDFHGWRFGIDGSNVEIRDEIRSEEHTSELQSLMRTPSAIYCWNKKTQDDSYNYHHHYDINDIERKHTTQI